MLYHSQVTINKKKTASEVSQLGVKQKWGLYAKKTSFLISFFFFFIQKFLFKT